MKKTADAVVIGGGIAGASTLYYLASMGLRETVLLEKGDLASGSTGDSAAMVRQHYSNEVSIRLVRESLRFFQGFADEFDGARVFNGIGWLFLCEPDAREAFDENMAQLKRLGVRTWEISPEDAAEELPDLNTDGIGPVAFEPDSGYADPRGTVSALVKKAETLGGRGLHAYGRDRLGHGGRPDIRRGHLLRYRLRTHCRQRRPALGPGRSADGPDSTCHWCCRGSRTWSSGSRRTRPPCAA